MREEINIRAIQHYMYCPHRWGLIEIGNVWAENLYVTRANLLHQRVHDPERRYTSKGKKVFTAVTVFNDLEEYNLYGITDCLELSEDAQGVTVGSSNEKYSIAIVEYKPTAPKNGSHREDDLMQIFAQKLCVDYTFHCESSTFIYYADTRRKHEIDFSTCWQDFSLKLKKLLEEMRMHLENGTIPAIRKGQKCAGCSMKDLCMPKMKSNKNVIEELLKNRQEML